VQGQCGVFVFVSEVHEVCLCCAVVLLFSQQATKRSGKAAGRHCGVLAWLLGFRFCVFGGFGAKLVNFKSSTLYDVVAMKLLATRWTTLFLCSNCPHMARAMVVPYGGN
jgi:hypothetical protein